MSSKGMWVTTLHRYVWLYNQQLPQSALSSKSPLQAMKDWHKLKPQLFRKQPYYLPGCDKYSEIVLPLFCAGSRSHSSSFDQRCRPDTFLTAIATARA